MESEVIRKLVSKRLTSKAYSRFLLADLFYGGYYLDDDNVLLGDKSFSEWEDNEYLELAYNPLKRQTKKKRNYLLCRPYTVIGDKDVQGYLSEQVSLLKDTVDELYKKGEVWWEFEPDAESPLKFKITLREAQDIVPKYINLKQTLFDGVGYLWNRIEGDTVYEFVDFVDAGGRYRIPLSEISTYSQEVIPHALDAEGGGVTFRTLPFIKLTADGLFDQIEILSKMYTKRYEQANSLLADNADPVAVIKNASDTDSAILREDIRENRIVKVEGDGDFNYASKTLEYNQIQEFMKMAKSDIADICGTVSREQELSYVTSGRALDRLYIDMDADAADMGGTLREALKKFLQFVDTERGKKYSQGFNIIFNTDKPTDEQQIISNINASRDLLSMETLLAQHPWVEDVQQEIRRKEKEDADRQPAPTPVAQATEEAPLSENVEQQEEIDK